MLFHQARELAEFIGAEAVVGGEGDGLEPELRLEIVAGDVDVGRLGPFRAVEVEAVGADAKHRGHIGKVAPARRWSTNGAVPPRLRRRGDR